MKKELAKLEVKDIASVEVINSTESPACAEFDVAKEKITNLKNDAAETAECLASINSTKARPSAGLFCGGCPCGMRPVCNGAKE